MPSCYMQTFGTAVSISDILIHPFCVDMFYVVYRPSEDVSIIIGNFGCCATVRDQTVSTIQSSTAISEVHLSTAIIVSISDVNLS
jgi:hypothetical protein